MSSLLLSILVVFLVLTVLGMAIYVTTMLQRTLKNRESQHERLVQDLLNRIQAGDLKSFQILKNSSTSELPKPVPQDDFSEWLRTQGNIVGYGEPIYGEVDAEARDAFAEGFNIEFVDGREELPIPGHKQGG